MITDASTITGTSRCLATPAAATAGVVVVVVAVRWTDFLLTVFAFIVTVHRMIWYGVDGFCSERESFHLITAFTVGPFW